MSKQAILVVDDKPANLIAVETTLGRLDVDLVKAESGIDALSLVLEYDIAVAILDVQMPDMDGYELATYLRGVKRTRDIPILFLSAVYSDDFHISKGYESGAVDFITKPYKPEILINKVKIFLQMDSQKKRFEQLLVEQRETNEQLKNEVQERRRMTKELQRKNTILEKLAILDGLTELYNHRYILERLREEIATASRYSNSLCVALIDIDFFKKVNDENGHQVGDEVLFALANIFREMIREVDICGRYGGEEFLILFPHTDLEGAFVAVEKIRKHVELFPFTDNKLQITISAGVGEYGGESPNDLVNRVDQLLYQAKGNGRNRTESEFNEGMED